MVMIFIIEENGPVLLALGLAIYILCKIWGDWSHISKPYWDLFSVHVLWCPPQLYVFILLLHNDVQSCTCGPPVAQSIACWATDLQDYCVAPIKLEHAAESGAISLWFVHCASSLRHQLTKVAWNCRTVAVEQQWFFCIILSFTWVIFKYGSVQDWQSVLRC